VAYKQEKALFLTACRIVDGFFKRRCDQLTTALAPAVVRLNGRGSHPRWDRDPPSGGTDITI